MVKFVISKSVSMTTAAKREKLHDFVDSADDLQVKAIYDKIEDYITGKSSDSIIKIKKMDVTLVRNKLKG